MDDKVEMVLKTEEKVNLDICKRLRFNEKDTMNAKFWFQNTIGGW